MVVFGYMTSILGFISFPRISFKVLRKPATIQAEGTALKVKALEYTRI